MVFNYFLNDPAVLPKSDNLQKQPTRGVPRKRRSENMQQIYRRAPMPKCDFNKVAKQLYWNHTSAWVFSCKFAAYLQNIFSKEHLWMAASVFLISDSPFRFSTVANNQKAFYIAFICFSENHLNNCSNNSCNNKITSSMLFPKLYIVLSSA